MRSGKRPNGKRRSGKRRNGRANGPTSRSSKSGFCGNSSRAFWRRSRLCLRKSLVGLRRWRMSRTFLEAF